MSVSLLPFLSFADAANHVMQVTKLEKDIEQLRADIIEKDDVLVEAVREKAAGDEDAANDVKRLRGEKKVLQAQLECKTRQLKVSNPCLIPCAAFASWWFFCLTWECCMALV